jgi:hypothetical protein
MTSIGELLRQRKEQKKLHRMGITTDALLKASTFDSREGASTGHAETADATVEYKKAKDRFVLQTSQSDREKIHPLHNGGQQPEEIQLKSRAPRSPEYCRASPTWRPGSVVALENLFFEFSESQQVKTDEQFYEEFITDYLFKGIEDANKRRRRKQRAVRVAARNPAKKKKNKNIKGL